MDMRVINVFHVILKYIDNYYGTKNVLVIRGIIIKTRCVRNAKNNVRHALIINVLFAVQNENIHRIVYVKMDITKIRMKNVRNVFICVRHAVKNIFV